ncbi:hypothetical protein ACFLR4_04665 [Bacteroidota bacterium]
MGGKGAILLVLGFSLIFLVAGVNFNRVATNSIDNMTDYYCQTAALNLASSGANMACNRLFIDNSWSAGYSNLSFGEGEIDVDVETIDVYQNVKKITATGTLDGETKEIQVILQPSKFSKFAYYSANEPDDIWWRTGDTVWGPFHVQGSLRVSGSPVFMGKVSNQDGLVMYDPGKWEKQKIIVDGKKIKVEVWIPGSDDPKFYGGYEEGIDVSMPEDGVSNLEAAAAAGGAKFTNQDTVYLTFQGDSLKYKFAANDAYTTVLLSTFAPNGAIFVDNGNIRLKGTIKGQYTIGAGEAHDESKKMGQVFIDDDVVYNTDPRIDPNSQDLFGIVTENDVQITDNIANQAGITIHASIYCEDQGFGAENHDTRPISGYIDLLGGIQQNIRRGVGTFNEDGQDHGFSKRYKYDERLAFAAPPFFPGTGSFEIVSWYE